MSLLSSLKTNEKVAEEKDSVGGGNGPLDSNIYLHKVGMAYIGESEGGAMGLYLTLVGEDKKEFRTTLWMTSGKAKGQKTFYTNPKDNENYPLPGYTAADALAQLTTGKHIFDLEDEVRVISLYNFTSKADVPTSVKAVPELIGKMVYTGVIKQLVNKSAKGDDGKYVDVEGIREQNEIGKFFCADDRYLKMTTTEIKAKAEVAKFYDQWKTKWEGQVQDKTTKVDAGQPGSPKAAASGTSKPSSSLFGDEA